MSPFWCTIDTMLQLRGGDCQPFALFGPACVLGLLLIVFAIWAVLYLPWAAADLLRKKRIRS